MPKRELADFIAHWRNATAPEQSVSQQFLCELCDLLDVPQPGNQRNGGYTFEFHVKDLQPDGSTREGRIDLYKRACFVLESKKFEAKSVLPTPLEIAAAEMGAATKRRKVAAPVRDTDRWDDAMLKAFVQARDYVRALPTEEPAPPFLLVVDVGHVIELRADFSLTGRAYQPFPDPLTYRIRLEQLREESIRKRLKQIWTEPGALDPSQRSAEVTREVAKHLAELAKSFEQSGHAPKIVAEFLTRCLFCMFAEDVGLLYNAEGRPGFTALLNQIPAGGEGFETMLRTLFAEMNEGRNQGGEVSVILRRKLLRFNGGLFADHTVLPVNTTQLAILKRAAELDWRHVEPAIFGTLLERALGGEGERHKLGAHFTPRSYVERLVLPTVIEPLRVEWENVRAAAVQLGKRGRIEKAREEINRFHQRLCGVKVLDPACGSGNFLYVALEHLKRLEGEVWDFAGQFGESFKLEMTEHTVDPHQFLGLEINPRAVAIAELVLWIGYLQWHFRTRGQTLPAEPVLRNFQNIQCRDAVLTYDGEPQPQRDAAGNIQTVWDRRSMKTDPLTGRDVPDETRRVPLLTYPNPRPTVWPEAEFIIGNPPFLGARTIRPALDDGYLDSLRGAYPHIPENADFVMYWWHKSAELVQAGQVKRFGLITTNSLRQSFNRQVTEAQLKARPPLSLVFAIPDHPWVDTADGAAVRIAMTVGVAGATEGELLEVKDEQPQTDGSAKVTFREIRGKILPDLRIGAEVTSVQALRSNEPFCCVGYQLTGKGFVLTPEEKEDLARKDGIAPGEVLYPLLSARDITQETRGLWAIDLFGETAETAREKFPAVFQWVLTRVKAERDSNQDSASHNSWWLFARPRAEFRPVLAGLKRLIVAPLTSKHRMFVFCEPGTIADSTTVLFALDDAFHLGVLSSRIHVVYTLTVGGTLEDRPRYNKSDCFDPFPFPLCGDAEMARIRQLAEALDAHRKQAQTQYGITLTGLYNVLEKLRADERLTAKEASIHDRGLVSTLESLHDDLDAAVFAAYGWSDLWKVREEAYRGRIYDFETGYTSMIEATFEQFQATLTEFEQALDAELLKRLVELNAERTAEEARGVIHWLRPEYQVGRPTAKAGKQRAIDLPEPKVKRNAPKSSISNRKLAWPKALPERVQAVEVALRAAATPITPAELTRQFARAREMDVAEILRTLETLGRARSVGEGKFSP